MKNHCKFAKRGLAAALAAVLAISPIQAIAYATDGGGKLKNKRSPRFNLNIPLSILLLRSISFM